MLYLTSLIYQDPEAARLHLEAILWPDGPVCRLLGVTVPLAIIEKIR